MRVDDNWCDEALALIRGLPVNLIICSLGRQYGYYELKPFDLIISCTTGTDHIDNCNIPLISLKGETEFLMNVWATAEHALALIMALVRKVPFAFNDVVQSKNWNREAWQGIELQGRTLGIAGLGRVGRQIAFSTWALGMKSIAYDPNEKEEVLIRRAGNYDFALQEKLVSLNELLRRSDIVTVHVPLTSETTGMFGRRQFEAMQPTAFFINTSRGAVVDEDALLWALENGEIAGAALDVLCNEPDVNSALIGYAQRHDNLIITPHIAGNTAESRMKTQLFIAEKIREFVTGGGMDESRKIQRCRSVPQFQ